MNMSNLSFKKLIPSFPKTFNEDGFSKFVRENSKISWTITLAEFLQCTAKESEKESEEDNYLVSSVFPEDPKANFKWCLKLFPFDTKSTHDNVTEYSGIYLFLESTKLRSPISMEAFLYCQNNNNGNLKECLLKRTYNGKHYGYGSPQFMRSSVLQSYLTGDSVTFHAKVSAMYDANSPLTNNFTSEEMMQDNYLNLLENGTLSDVTFYTEDNTEFKVHMNILTVRSKGLAAILFDKMNENPTGKIVIENCSGTTMKNILRFIYCCKIEFLDVAETENILKATEEYEILGLKLQCLDFLYSIINEENVCSILLIAEQYNLPDLKQETFKYIRGRKRKFSSVDSYDLILQKKPRLLTEISVELAKSNKSVADSNESQDESDESQVESDESQVESDEPNTESDESETELEFYTEFEEIYTESDESETEYDESETESGESDTESDELDTEFFESD